MSATFLPINNYERNVMSLNKALDNTQWEVESHSSNTTRDSTPERKRSPCFFQSENQEEEKEFIIDVKPRKKQFRTAEERREFVKSYQMKYKTELCKNFELRGWCKFGDTCSFAHGKHELQQKVHLHEKFKTRHCQQFHQLGYCKYGNRCQYLHKEALGPNIFYQPSNNSEMLYSAERNNYTFELVDEIWRMSTSNIKVEKILEKIPAKKRLPIFEEIAP